MILGQARRAMVLGALSVPLLMVACGGDEVKEPVTVEGSGVAPAAAPASQPSVPREGKPLQYDAPPPMTIDPTKKYTATLVIAQSVSNPIPKGGEVEIELFADDAPITVNNFVFLAREGYYDGVTFHRVITNFMAQTGDPTGTGSGGPGYKFESELTPKRRHDGPGVVSMANSGGTKTNGSQFFITFTEVGSLDGHNPDGTPKKCEDSGVSCHTVFGKVIKGMDVVLDITARDPTAAGVGDLLKSVTIREE